MKSRINPSHPKSSSKKEKDYKYNEDELHSYLNRVVDRHYQAAKGRVETDLREVGDCLYLNKFSKMATSELVNPALLGQSTVGLERSELDDTHSQEKLSRKFGASRSRSPMKAAPDMTSLLMDTETRRYVNEYKN